ncbi:LacI family DNA-binding transcriptional regulator [Clostridium saccharobutylicum]|uniref:LacI family DNA-binding transcriptional regulator n=1 Tax=Clostridium saccharobutylicum TaxID=169679 RepID=UPI001494F3BF|nr:LacI family DNA-binding transcriptional regulator [Clostridium saccharobutylicum]NOV80399.1 LacI family transcriptional regulator [Clostridium saccharobutylicum]
MATIKDVAKKAGVSVGYVSRFINNFEVKPKTRLAIEKAIKELDYEPNIYARGFKVNKTNTIALIIPTVWNPFFGELAFNIEKSLRDYGMKMILCNSGNDYEIELQYITMAKQNKVDGIISITYSDVDKYVHSNMPIISIDRYFSEDITYVTSDNFEGGRMAAEELMKSGCKSIAFIGRGSKIDNATRNRKKGFVNYCEENHIHYEICDSLGESQNFKKKLDKFLYDNLKNVKKIDGIFTVTDEHAFKVIGKLNKLNVDVPEDVQIIGYDGIKSHNNDTIKISTIRQPIESIANESVKALINIINNKEIEKEIILPVRFIKGFTTK